MRNLCALLREVLFGNGNGLVLLQGLRLSECIVKCTSLGLAGIDNTT